MGINVNCRHNDHGAWCKNLNIKRSLFGVGARRCVLYPYLSGNCQYQERYPKPNISPRPQKTKTNPYEYACKEWLRGCSCSIDFKTLKNNPETCDECTESFHKYIKYLEHNEKHTKK